VDGFLKEIEGLRKQLAEKENTLEKIRAYISDSKKNLSHIEVELGMKAGDISIIDLSGTPTTPAPEPSTSIATKPTTRNIRTTSTISAVTRPAAVRARRELFHFLVKFNKSNKTIFQIFQLAVDQHQPLFFIQPAMSIKCHHISYRLNLSSLSSCEKIKVLK
jgi:hypothetical protein